jgi:hypothetical protein
MNFYIANENVKLEVRVGKSKEAEIKEYGPGTMVLTNADSINVIAGVNSFQTPIGFLNVVVTVDGQVVYSV